MTDQPANDLPDLKTGELPAAPEMEKLLMQFAATVAQQKGAHAFAFLLAMLDADGKPTAMFTSNVKGHVGAMSLLTDVATSLAQRYQHEALARLNQAVHAMTPSTPQTEAGVAASGAPPGGSQIPQKHGGPPVAEDVPPPSPQQSDTPSTEAP